jgi:ABC-2 type transport system ATP-binding protein
MPPTLVEVKNLSKTYKTPDGPFHAVKSVSLDIYKGEIFSLLGPNGAGKTTLISMISGLLSMTDGAATIGGHSIQTDPLLAKKLLGVVPQEIALYENFTARQNLAFFGRLYGMGGAELNRRIDEVLEFIDLTDRQHDKVKTFSGGMKRRVNIGVGLLHKPQLVYMDEPTVGIDPQNRRRILDTVFRLRDEYGMTVLYTTHLMEESQEISDRVGIIDHGEIIALGTVGELTQQVGEEDRLVFQIAASTVDAAFIKQLETGVETVTRVLHEIVSDRDTPALQLTVFAKRGRKAMPDVISLANAAGLDVMSVEVKEPDLEAVFLNLTGRALRD